MIESEAAGTLMTNARRVLAYSYDYLLRCISIDTRALALFRMLAGILIIADLIARAGRFSYLYTDGGVVPQWLAIHHAPQDAFSFYYWSTDPYVIAGLFVLQGLIGLVLIVGYKTRLVTVLAFLFVVSLNNHNPLVLSHADTLFRMLLFWAIFLPLGERWSVDASHAKRAPREYVTSIASAAILVQMVYMYFVNWSHKVTNELWTSGDATPLIFGLDDTTFLFGDMLRNVPTFLQGGGLLWYYLLMFSPLFLLLQGRPRILYAFLLIGGHAAFGLTVRIGAFPYVGILGVLLFLQADFFRYVRTLLELAPGYARSQAARLAPLGNRFAARLPRFNLSALLPKQVMTGASDLATILVATAVIALLVLPGITMLDRADVVSIDTSSVEQHTRQAAGVLGVRQSEWRVFAPNPRTVDRYHVFAAETVDGELLDIYNDRAFTFDRPHKQLQRQYPSYRERFYMNAVRRAGLDGPASSTLGDHLCDHWEQDRSITLTHIEMYVVEERVTIDTIDDPEGRESNIDLFHRHVCGDHEPRDLMLPSSEAIKLTQ